MEGGREGCTEEQREVRRVGEEGRARRKGVRENRHPNYIIETRLRPCLLTCFS